MRLDHVLGWKGLRGGDGSATTASAAVAGSKSHVTVEEIWSVVEGNEKKRFAVKVVSSGNEEENGKTVGREDEKVADRETQDGMIATAEAEESETAKAISTWRSDQNTTVSQYFIRAVQGHSIASVTNDEALSPITLDNPASIPSTVVHGTFYASWPLILASGGLKRMGRNCVHFATGPAIEEILPAGASRSVRAEGGNGNRDSDTNETVLAQNKVISGMRRDAQVLIYIDLRACLEDIKTKNLDMSWYRSENGVVLTEGLDENTARVNEEVAGGQGDILQDRERKNGKAAARQDKRDEIVPMRYVTRVVECRNGLGVIWTKEDGEIQRLPEDLLRIGTPKGRGGGGGGAKRGSGRGRGRGRDKISETIVQ